jgi:SAM-dependent methyltransferase
MTARSGRLHGCEMRRLVVGTRSVGELGRCDIGIEITEAAHIPLDDASIDVVTFRGLGAGTGRRSLGEAVRVLKPGGRLRIHTDGSVPRHEITGELRRLGCVGVVVRELKSGDLAIEARRGRRPVGPELHRVCGPPRSPAPLLERSHGVGLVA